MISTSWSAPICIVLSGGLGERYGKPLLACATDHWVMCNVRKGGVQKSKNSRVLHIEKSVIDYLRRKSITMQVPDHSLHITSGKVLQIDPTETSAFTVVATSGLLEFFTGKTFTQEEVNTLAFYIEKNHNFSELGYRTSTSSFGGILYARKEFEFLKNISRLSFKIPANVLSHLYIKPNNPKPHTIMKKFGRIYDKDPQAGDAILNRLERSTRRLTVGLSSGNAPLIQQSIDEEKNTYDELGLTPEYSLMYSKHDEKLEGFFPLKIDYRGLRKVIY